MSFGSSQWMYNAGSDFYGFDVSNSLRFEDGDSAYLNRTPSSASNRKTFTWSSWVKRGNLGLQTPLFSAEPSTSLLDSLTIPASDKIQYYNYDAPTDYGYATTAVYRDASAWYHIVFAVDTTQGTASNRCKLYVNGEQQTFNQAYGDIPQNTDTQVNATVLHLLGRDIGLVGAYLDGYLAEVNFIDGAALTPSSFGETKNDIWIPKNTSGLTFGTNGFRLQFKQVGTGTASSSTIGADTSGNGNHWTSNALVASDVVPDSPTNNFATINPVDSAVTLSQGNLNFINGAGGAYKAQSTLTIPNIADSQKYYVEFVSDAGFITGILPDNISGANNNADRTGMYGYYITGTKLSGTTASSYGASFGTGDQMGMLIGNGAIEFFKNSTSQGVAFSSLTGAYKVVSSAVGGTNAGITFNFGQDSSFAGAKTAQGNADANGVGDFYYTVPSGALALCTSNLPSPVEAIDPAEGGSPQDFFNTVLYTGNGSTQSITGAGFQPDFTWIKNRDAADSHALTDSVRGVTKQISSDSTAAESTNADGLTAFGTDGFSLGADVIYNTNTENYASWNWKAGTAFSNDASATGVGSIDSAGSVNTDVGFSIINYVGSGGADTYAHGLGVTPEMIMVKDRTDPANWAVYHSAVGTGKYLELNTTDAVTTDGVQFASVTSTVIGVGIQGDGSITNSVNDNYIAYCFASVDGYSKIGSYTGNGSADGPFIYTGFKPAMVIIKVTSTTGGWNLQDNVRSPTNPIILVLGPNFVDVEYSSTNYSIDTLSNGFKLRNSIATWNASGANHIYMAFAEQPFKFANAR